MNQEYLAFAKDFAKEAGKIMLSYFNNNRSELGIEYKPDKTIVTKADTEINDILIDRVKDRINRVMNPNPQHAVKGEEKTFGKSDYTWVCDPVDGTNVFARHIPVSVFSLALLVKGESILGVVYDPFTDSLYSAVKGEGAFLNDIPIRVNNYQLDDRMSTANFEMWPTAPYNMYSVVSELGRKTYFVNLGSIIRASVAVASGDFSMAIFPGVIKCPHDIAAIKVIVEEAGGKVTSLFGDEERYDQDIITGAVVSNGVVHDEVVRTVIKYHPYKIDPDTDCWSTK